MNDTVLIAILTLAGTIISGIVSALIANRLTVYRIDQLEKKVDKHNNLVERMYKVEGDIETLQHDISLLQKKGA